MDEMMVALMVALMADKKVDLLAVWLDLKMGSLRAVVLVDKKVAYSVGLYGKM